MQQDARPKSNASRHSLDSGEDRSFAHSSISLLFAEKFGYAKLLTGKKLYVNRQRPFYAANIFAQRAN